MGLSFEEIKELIKLINDSDINKAELKYDDIELKLSKESEIKHISPIHQEPQEKSDENSNEIKVEKNIPESEMKKENIHENAEAVKSPIVGTFYDSPFPEADPYVRVGDRVKEGDVLCIVEAMKIMNEIKSQFDGEVAEILLENEDIVEYNQPIMIIRR